MSRQFAPGLLRFALISILLIPGLAMAQDGKAMSLQECIEIARANSPSLLGAQQSLDLAGENVLSAYGAFLPRFSADFGYAHSYIGPQPGRVYFNNDTQQFVETPAVPSADYESYSMGISGSMTLFAGFGNMAALSAQKWEQEATRSDLDATIAAVDQLVIKAYYEVFRAQKIEELNQGSLELSRESFAQVRRAFMMGAVARSDTLQASVNLAESQLALLEAESSLDIAMLNLTTALGIEPFIRIRVEALESIDFTELDCDEVMQAAFDSNPDLQASRARLAASGAGLKQAKSALWPSVSAGYRYSWGDLSPPDGFGDFFEDNFNYSFSVGMSIPIFDGFRTRQGISQARVGKRLSEYGIQEQERALTRSVESLLVTLENSRLRVELARHTIVLASEELRQARERYRVGAATLLEVSEAEVSLTRARSSEIDGMTAYLSALADLESSTGMKLSGGNP
jgi:outer membrane protein